jgi:DNA-directed RNA polymerase sigma subunit (sigma70/sigma32)
MSTTEILARLATLSPEDRALIRDRLDALDDMVMELSPEERRMVASRVAAHRQNPELGTSWAVAEESIRQELGL